ncbi:hypothetical protein A4A49_09933 [Nicotiana attenuata]|uniref:Uncharacterized protein n=1 Tax=Nicotiana attenuata TaxID=49451 RepID=A0A1J6HU18_NICAT|nr:hypothetical protein A4A49_09933 [Nicotiana attenuata]
MLKAILILGSSSGFLSCRFRKPQPNSGLFLISTRKSIGTISVKTDSLLLPASHYKGRFRMSSTHSKSNPDGPSSSQLSSSSVAAIQSIMTQDADFCCFWCHFLYMSLVGCSLCPRLRLGTLNEIQSGLRLKDICESTGSSAT